MRTSRKAQPLIGSIAVIVMAALGPSVGSSAAQASVTHVRTTVASTSCIYPSNVCNPSGYGVNIRNTPHASGNRKFLNYGNGLFINCWRHGQTIPGPWGTSDIWDFITWSNQYQWTYKGYVSDTFVYTGSNGPPSWVGQCPANWAGNV
jgi:hypothetical protein